MKIHIELEIDGDERDVWLNGVRLHPQYSQTVFNHASEFNWGYEGSGPAQTALAILLATGIPKEDAVRLHQAFKRDVIARYPMDRGATIHMDMDIWFSNHGYSTTNGWGKEEQHGKAY